MMSIKLTIRPAALTALMAVSVKDSLPECFSYLLLTRAQNLPPKFLPLGGHTGWMEVQSGKALEIGCHTFTVKVYF